MVCWLAAMCHHLYATVASIPRRDDPPSYLKYSLFAWGTPLLDLAIATFLQIREATVIWNIADLTPFNCWYIFFSPSYFFLFLFFLPSFMFSSKTETSNIYRKLFARNSKKLRYGVSNMTSWRDVTRRLLILVKVVK